MKHESSHDLSVHDTLQRVDAFSNMPEQTQEELAALCTAVNVSSGQVLTFKGANVTALYIVATQGAALIDEETGEVVSRGVLVDVSSLVYGSDKCMRTLRAGKDCVVYRVDASHFPAWRVFAAYYLAATLPLLKTLPVEQLMQLKFRYTEIVLGAPLDLVTDVALIISGVVRVSSDGPSTRAFEGHIVGMREYMCELQCEVSAVTPMVRCALLPHDVVEELLNFEPFLITVCDSVYQKSVVTEAIMISCSEYMTEGSDEEDDTGDDAVSAHSEGSDELGQGHIPLTKRAELHRDSKALSCINEYYVLSRLGQGATASVYLCGKQRTPDAEMEHMAIKAVPRSSALPLKRELTALRKLRHSNMIRLLEVIDDPLCDRVFLVLELAQHSMVSVLLRTTSEAQRFAAEMLSVLGYMHKKHYIHRDIKPANIVRMVDGSAKLADFGCAVHVGDTSVKGFAGTPAFMAPEVLSITKVTPAVDVWALVATLHCLVYGSPPFPAHLRVELEDAIMYQPPDENRAGRTTDDNWTAEEISSFRHLCMQGLIKDYTQRITIEQMQSHPWLRAYTARRRMSL